jgi:N-acetyl sugar amidotransferase
MNVLYLANPFDGHDIKWISYFVENKLVKGFLMPRKSHKIPPSFNLSDGLQIVGPIPDFSILRFHQTLLTAYKIKQFIRKNEIHAIHILFAEPNALWCLFKTYFGVPVIVTCRGTDVLKTIPRAFKEHSLINSFVAPAYRRAFIKADFVTGTSYHQLVSIANFSGRDRNISVVRTGVDINKLLGNTSHEFPFTDQKPYILLPRYIKPLYNHEFCLDAIQLLPAKIKSDYRVVLVGKSDSDQQAAYQALLEERISSMPEVEFAFLPEMTQESMFELYKRASLVVMTPHSDGSPVSAMEAIVCGANVILGPLPYDEIFDEWTFRLKSWNQRELADLILHCLSVPKKNNVKTFFPLVDRTIQMEMIRSIYNNVVGQASAVKLDEIPYTQCSRCILDTRDDGEIKFDETGVCSFCRAYDLQELKQVKKGEAGAVELAKLVKLVKDAGEGKTYDCILGVSGGVDSTYLAFQAKKLGLRPLAVHFDNGWNSELAVGNIENIINRLGFDLHTFVIDWEEFKDIQLSFLKASVVDIELVTDHAILTKLYQLAIKHKIKYILSGTNVVTEAVLPPSWIHNKRDHVHIRAVHERFGTVPIKTYPLFTSALKWNVVWKEIKSLSLLDLMPYNKTEVKKTITNELGWRDYGGKHYESVFTRFYQGYILPTKFRIDKRKAHLSNLICSGQMTRDEALEEIKRPIYDETLLKTDYDFVLKKLGLTEEDFVTIMEAPVRKHTEFLVEESIYDRFPLLKIVRPVWQKIKQFRKLK